MCKDMAKRSTLAQAWLDTRFQGLTPSDFGRDGVRIYFMSQLKLPEAFDGYWSVFDDSSTSREHSMSEMEVDSLRAAQALLIFSDLYDEDQMKNIEEFISVIDNLDHDAPPMFLVTHTCEPSIREAETGSSFPLEKYKNIMELGIDDLIENEPCGFMLAMMIRAKLSKAAVVSQSLSDVVNDRQQRVQLEKYLKQCVCSILWEYLRIRVAPCIPPLNPNLLDGNAAEVDGFTIGPLLGKGMSGSVYQLVNGKDGSSSQVIKLQSKHQFQDLQDLKTLKRTIDISKMLSSDRWAHPKVVKLYQVHHSERNIWLRMEDAGPENMYQRLAYRQKDGPKHRPLALDKVRSVLFDLIDVMEHLHVNCSICHRDIKPENLIVNETHHSIAIKLVDFDMAVVMPDDNSRCHSTCGTMPFTAPEVLLDREYGGKKADIWSMGVVLLELLCGVRVLEDALKLDAIDPKHVKPGERPEISVARKIRAHFEPNNQVSRLLKQNSRSELRCLLPSCTPLLTGMLSVSPVTRWDATQCLDAVKPIQAA